MMMLLDVMYVGVMLGWMHGKIEKPTCKGGESTPPLNNRGRIVDML